MTYVAAHDVDLDQLRVILDDKRALLDHARRHLATELSPRNLYAALTNVRGAVDVLARLAPDSPELAPWCSFIARATAALFTFARRPERARWPLLGAGRTLAGEVRSEFLEASSWLTGFWLAWASRDAAALALLAQVPPALVAETEAFDRPLVRTLQGLLAEAPDTGAALVEVLELADPARMRRTSPDWVLYILVPVCECLVPLIDHDEEGFAAALVKLLELRRDYFARGLARGSDSIAHLSEEGAGLLAWARAYGLAVPVESEYLPRALVEAEPADLAACPACVTPAGDDTEACLACARPLGDAALHFGFDEWLGLGREACRQCGHAYPLIATLCPVCLAPRHAA